MDSGLQEEVETGSRSNESISSAQSVVSEALQRRQKRSSRQATSRKETPEEELIRVQAGIRELELRLLQAAQLEVNEQSVKDLESSE